MRARVGVCTRPMLSTCRFCPYFKVYRRVAFIPKIQSPMARLSPARYSGWYSLWSFRLAKPWRMASSVSDEIHNRLTGHLACAFCITHLCISSPSCPASPQFTISSAFCMSRSITWNCFSIPRSSISFMPKRWGIMGSAPKLHLFQLSV